MFTRFDKAIAAGASSGAATFAALNIDGDQHHYGLLAAVIVGLAVGIFTFAVPNKPAAPPVA